MSLRGYGSLLYSKNENYREEDTPCDVCLKTIFGEERENIFMDTSHFAEMFCQMTERGYIDKYITFAERYEENTRSHEDDSKSDSDDCESDSDDAGSDSGCSESEEADLDCEKSKQDVSEPPSKKTKKSIENSKDNTRQIPQTDKLKNIKSREKQQDTRMLPPVVDTLSEKMTSKYLNGAYASVKYLYYNIGDVKPLFEKRLMASSRTGGRDVTIPHIQCDHRDENCPVGNILRNCELCCQKMFLIPREICMNFWIQANNLTDIAVPMLAAVHISNCRSQENGWRLLFQTNSKMINLGQLTDLAVHCKNFTIDKDEIVRQCINCLERLHTHRLLHNDIKPDNIMVDFSRRLKVRLIDFDNAQWLHDKVLTYNQPDFQSPIAARAIFYKTVLCEDWFDNDKYSMGLTCLTHLTGCDGPRIPIDKLEDISKGYKEDLYAIKSGIDEAHGVRIVTEDCGDNNCLYCHCFFGLMNAKDDATGWFTFCRDDAQLLRGKGETNDYKDKQ